jgi:hypothetical protein
MTLFVGLTVGRLTCAIRARNARHACFSAQNHLRSKTHFHCRIKPVAPASPLVDFFTFFFPEIVFSSPRPVLTRGAFRDRHER